MPEQMPMSLHEIIGLIILAVGFAANVGSWRQIQKTSSVELVELRKTLSSLKTRVVILETILGLHPPQIQSHETQIRSHER